MFRSSLSRNALFALFIVGILAYGATLAWHRLTSFDLVNLIFGDVADDAFYYFQIAYHLSEGRFSTFDGGVTRTNGYHPFWLLMITPLYWFFDKEDALFAVKVFEIALIAGGTALIVAAARRERDALTVVPCFQLGSELGDEDLAVRRVNEVARLEGVVGQVVEFVGTVGGSIK